MHFADPALLALLPAVAAVAWLTRPTRANAAAATLGFAALPFLAGTSRLGRARWSWVLRAFRLAALVLLVTALARPRSERELRQTLVRGRNIVFVLDISSSMKAIDFKAGNRLEVAKSAIRKFIRSRQGDFLGLIVFAGRAFVQAPLTNSTELLLDLLDRADIGMLPDGTAIGTALAMGENRLKELPRGSGALVLVTDGGNNTGAPDPLTAAEAARALGIRIYTIGVSSHAATPLAPYRTGRPATMEAPSALSKAGERTLERIASISGGRYFRAADQRSMTDAAGEIDRLEKTERRLTEVRSYHEWYPLLALPALALLLAQGVLGATWLRRLP